MEPAGNETPGVYVIDVVPPEPESVIAGASVSGDEQRFTFIAIAGRSDVIESRPELTDGEWTMVPSTTTAGDGGTQQVSIPIPTTPTRQFYRIRQL